MKKTVISAALFILLVFLMALSASAEGGDAASVSSLSIVSYPTKTVYGAFEQLDTSGLTLRAFYSDGSERIVSGDDVTVAYNQDGCLRVGDDSVNIFYGNKSVRLPITVNRISYDLSALDLKSFSVVYNGQLESYNRTIPQIVGLDGLPLSINISGGGINVGVYDLTVDFASESKDYLIPDGRVISMTVTPATANMVWDKLSFVYDGKSKTPVAYYIDVFGARVYPTVSGGAINAGGGYIAHAATNDSNYSFTNTSVTYEIRKADYDMSGVVWSKDSFTYDGSKKSISASGLPAGVSIIGYSGDIATAAGKYTATALLKWDEANYNKPATITHEWEIKKADYDMTGISFRNESHIYDGRVHYPTLIGSMPVGADGITLEYSFSAGAVHVADGVVSVTVKFHTSSDNYNTPKEMYSSVSITPCGISVTWGALNLTYNGEEQMPSAYSVDCTVNVSGGAVDTGKYVAVAFCDNDDYYVTNSQVEFTITKAQNYWSELPTDSVCYEGREIKLTGEGRFGVAKYIFYSEPECENEISAPKERGKYYAVIIVEESSNFSGLRSEAIAFEIVEIVPVSFIAEIVREGIVAFDTLGEGDIVCSVMNNDGSLDTIDYSQVNIIYNNGDSFRKSDTTVKIKYGEYVISLEVSVDYADYDLSGVVWNNTVQAYDGTPKMPELTGLPDGVTVKEYISGNNINAGNYTVSVILDYDTENYNPPIVMPCQMTVEKCSISIPLITAIYNGNMQSPIPSSTLYTITTDERFKQTGSYSVLITLTDPQNYVFNENAGQSANAIFRILPAEIAVRVNDVKLRLFEDPGEVGYIVTEGEIYGDDILTVSAYAEKRLVYIRSENPNYTLQVTPGKITRLPYPTVNGAVVLIGILLLLLVISIVCIILYRNRNKLATAAAMAKCRAHNRNYKAPMPRGMASGELKINENNISRQIILTENNSENRGGDIMPTSVFMPIDAERADSMISDSLAKSLVRREGEIVYTDGDGRGIINLGDISAAFAPDDNIDVNSMKEKGLISPDIAYIKVLGGGKINKPLTIRANDFSLSAIKMIALSGGSAVKIVTFKSKERDEKE